MKLKIISIIALITISLSVNAQTQKSSERNEAASRMLFELPPFERAVCCIRFYEGLHRKKDYPYVGYGHKLRPGERYSSNMTAREAEDLLRKDRSPDSHRGCSLHRDERHRLCHEFWHEPDSAGLYRDGNRRVRRVNKTILSADLAIHYGDGIPMATLWEGDYPVKMVLKSENDSDLANEYIPVMGGTSSVPLRQLAKISPDWHDGSIIRRNGVRTISIIGEPLRGFNANQLANELKQEVSKLPLDSSLDWEIGGMAEKDAETLPQVTSGVMIAALIIFFILLFHFKRISLALVNLSSMSLCIFGAAIGLLVTGFDVSLTCILGIVSLMGILVRNGIIMLDYAEELRRDKGLSVKEAAFQAGERRMRPIFLTSAAASVGVLPMMVENNTLWSPMGAVIFFGTLISMVLIATILPVLYWLVFDKHGKYSLRKQ